MSMQTGALVYYKTKAALVTAVSDKIDIVFPGTGKKDVNKRVRDKDITLLHPGPVNDIRDINAALPEAEKLDTLEETLELLEEEAVPLAELAELLYGDYTPQSAWSSWMLVMDELYFTITDAENVTAAIQARPLNLIREEREKRLARQRQKESWEGLIKRIQSGQIMEEDYSQLTEVEQLATAERENSRILKAAGIPENKEAAHALLIKLGYWQEDYNPWLRRMGVNTEEPALPVPEITATERRDLTHLTAWAIDDIGNQDPDDAISLEGDTLWVHIADVSALVVPDSELDIEARTRGTNIYLPDQTLHMLPRAITEQLGLGLQEQSPALSIGFRVSEKGELENIEVCLSTVHVTRTTYDQANTELDTTFADLKAITDRYRQRRIDNGAAMLELPEVNITVQDGNIQIYPYQSDGSRQMVAEAMLAAGEAIATYAGDNNIPIPYAYQPEPEEIQHPQSLSEHYAYRRCFKASRHATEAESHFGLGLPRYTRVTSPLRRYLDLIVHQQLRAYLNNHPLLDREALIERIGIADEASFAARKAERFSNQHWKLLYFKQYQQQQGKQWQGEAIVVQQEERKTTIILPELALEPKIRKQDKAELDDTIQVQVTSVNIPELQANFKVC